MFKGSWLNTYVMYRASCKCGQSQKPRRVLTPVPMMWTHVGMVLATVHVITTEDTGTTLVFLAANTGRTPSLSSCLIKLLVIMILSADWWKKRPTFYFHPKGDTKENEWKKIDSNKWSFLNIIGHNWNMW